MTNTTYRYRAVRVQQTSTSNWLVLFGAPATEIDAWAGAPQKKQLGGRDGTTTGFQRDIAPTRLENLKKFYADDRNTIQNPLLCATRDTSAASVRFIPDVAQVSPETTTTEVGTIEFDAEPLESHSLLDLLRRVKTDLERRAPTLKGQKPSVSRILHLKQQAQLATENGASEGENSEDTENGEDAASANDGSDADATSVVFSDESHIFEFWEDIAARISVLEEAGQALALQNEFAGFSKDAMVSFLRPVVVVDGQHRLRGAVERARDATNMPPYSTQIEQAVLENRDPEIVQREVEVRASRVLPVSLLMTDDPAEHVFQFVVVNQKATPIDRALLGTIVSTTLSNDELKRVSDRLNNAGIPLQESRTIAFLTRNPDSPFFGLVQRGLESDDQDLMPWTVLGSLVKVFQQLRGGRLYGEKNDYADRWRRNHLSQSSLVTEWEEHKYKNEYAYWSAPDGPWRSVFVKFWTCIRDRFADRTDHEAANYWGKNKVSNLFNKISLTILAADFFQYLCESKRTIDSIEHIDVLVEEWLKDVKLNYFNRPWPLAGVKKDSTGIRNRWAKLWSEYRKDPQSLPAVKFYRQPLGID